MPDYNLLGLCRRAGKLSLGHDASKEAIRSGRAKLVIIASDASERLCGEIDGLCVSVPVHHAEKTADEISHITGKKAAVMTVDDENFASGLIARLNKEN